MAGRAARLTRSGASGATDPTEELTSGFVERRRPGSRSADDDDVDDGESHAQLAERFANHPLPAVADDGVSDLATGRDPHTGSVSGPGLAYVYDEVTREASPPPRLDGQEFPPPAESSVRPKTRYATCCWSRPRSVCGPCDGGRSGCGDRLWSPCARGTRACDDASGCSAEMVASSSRLLMNKTGSAG